MVNDGVLPSSRMVFSYALGIKFIFEEEKNLIIEGYGCQWTWAYGQLSGLFIFCRVGKRSCLVILSHDECQLRSPLSREGEGSSIRLPKSGPQGEVQRVVGPHLSATFESSIFIEVRSFGTATSGYHWKKQELTPVQRSARSFILEIQLILLGVVEISKFLVSILG